MPDTQVVIDDPIINSPFEEPKRHYRFGDQGITSEIVERRRDSSYFIPIPPPRKKGKQLSFETEWLGERISENEFINRVRGRVSLWRRGGHAGVTRTTRRLLEHWSSPERERRLFFCQIEALEAAIYLCEVAGKYGDAWIGNELRQFNERANPGLDRGAARGSVAGRSGWPQRPSLRPRRAGMVVPAGAGRRAALARRVRDLQGRHVQAAAPSARPRPRRGRSHLPLDRAGDRRREDAGADPAPIRHRRVDSLRGLRHDPPHLEDRPEQVPRVARGGRHPVVGAEDGAGAGGDARGGLLREEPQPRLHDSQHAQRRRAELHARLHRKARRRERRGRSSQPDRRGVGRGQEGQAAKVATARDLWVPAINSEGTFGRWAFIEVADPWNAEPSLRAALRRAPSAMAA